MQISNQEVQNAQKALRDAKSQVTPSPIRSVEDLAAAHGVRMDEVRRFTEMAMMAEEDVARERRIQELSRRVEQGTYSIDADAVVDMAERRAIADGSR